MFENGKPVMWVPAGYVYSTTHGYFFEPRLNEKYAVLRVQANTVPAIRTAVGTYLNAQPQMGIYGQRLRANLVHMTALECNPKTIR